MSPRRDKQPASHGTRTARLSAAKGLFKWCVRQELVRTSPAAHVTAGRPPQRVPRHLTPDEIRLLLCEGCADHRDRAIIVTSLQVGMRRGELVRMDIEDVDWSTGILLIHGKGNRERRRPLPDEAAEMLQRLLAEYPAAEGPVFRSYKTGRRLTVAGMAHVTRLIFERSGIKRRAFDGKTLHACRHTMVSEVLATHGPWAANEAAGHESWSSFSYYARGMVSDELRQAMEGRRYAS
ncbi:MAG: tyrosine-type recombinase/integrase [Actinomycetota bacterium]